MVLLPLVLIVIGLAVSERIINKKKNKDWNKIRLIIGIVIACILFAISYFITDTTLGTIYVFLSMITYLSIGLIQNRINIEKLNYLPLIIGLPVMSFMFIKSIENMLINFSYILLFLVIINMILTYSPQKRSTSKEYLMLGIGILGALAVLFTYNKLSDSEDMILFKQEIVAQEYLEEELGLDGFEAYVRNTSISLRGEEKPVRVYDSTGRSMELIYKNNEIISWTEEQETVSYDFKLDATSLNAAEETVVNHFLYTIKRDYDSLSETLADIEAHRIEIENEEEDFKEGIYIKSYAIHRITTLSEEEYNKEELDNGEANPMFYYGWEDIVNEYELIEYEIINVNFTQEHSNKANELIPQWGDGTFSRNFIVGKTSDDNNYRIYDFGMMQ